MSDRKPRTKKKRKAWERKPILRLISKTYGQHKGSFDGGSFCNVLILENLVARSNLRPESYAFDEKVLDSNNLDYVEYALENAGLTSISNISFVANYPHLYAFCPVHYVQQLIVNEEYNIEVKAWSTVIRPGDKLKVRFYYLRGTDPKSLPSALVFLLDTNGNYWRQNFSIGEAILETPNASDHNDYKGYADLTATLEAFHNPHHQ